MCLRVFTIIAALAASPAALAAGPPAPLSFGGVELGTTKAAWLALKTPASASAHTRRACSDDSAGAAAGLNARGLPKGGVVCALVDTYGALNLPVTFAWKRRYPMNHVRYVFQADRLTEIRATLPADAFDALMAEFRRAYGAPSQEIRDEAKSEIGRLPRVSERWLEPGGRIEVVDPTSPGKLSVRLSAR